MPALLLQKPSKDSKSKDHTKALTRRLELWKKGDIEELIFEAATIQSRLKNVNSLKTIAVISKKFANLMEKGNVNGALKLLTNNMANGILPLNDETLNLLHLKHPDAKEAMPDVLIQGPTLRVHPVLFDEIDEDLVKKAALRTKGGSGPSGLDADGWRRILASNNYGTVNIDLRRSFARVIQKLCIKKIEVDTLNSKTSIEALLACRLIPLDKNPGLRPIGVGEVLRRIAGKVVMQVVKSDVTKAAGCLQTCAGQESGSEASIHAMNEIFNENDTEAVLLVDAENAFNSINRQTLLHNIEYICPSIASFIYNCYIIPARLFIMGGKELKSLEGTTQGDPTAMATYALGLTPMLNDLSIIDSRTKHVAFADDLTGAGKLNEIITWWEHLAVEGPKYGYFPKPSKSILIVKEEFKNEAQNIFGHTQIKITTAGARHLGAVLGEKNFKDGYIKEAVESWTRQLEILSKIAELQPQAAYSAYIKGFKNKFTYFMRTIPNINEFMQPIEDILMTSFIPAISGGHMCSVTERELLELPVKFGGLAINNPVKIASAEYSNSRKITQDLKEKIVNQNQEYDIDTKKIKEVKYSIKNTKRKSHEEKIEILKEKVDEKGKRSIELSMEIGASNWLHVLPLKEYNYNLNKQQFWDVISMRYSWPIPGLSSRCVCSEKFDVQHAISCKKGGFVTLRHNEIRDISSHLLSEVCKDVELEPHLVRLGGEESTLNHGSKKNDDVRLDVSATGFWIQYQKAFFDIRVFDPYAKRCRYMNQSMKHCYITNEKEKKNHYTSDES
jgi:hypothetical protein